MRQASAEDLDAAHQLISSAQAGREHLGEYDRDGNVSSAAGADSVRTAHGTSNVANPSTSRRPDAPNVEKADEKTVPKSQRDTSFPGHSCRLVLGVALPSKYTLTLAVIVERRAPLCGGDLLQGLRFAMRAVFTSRRVMSTDRPNAVEHTRARMADRSALRRGIQLRRRRTVAALLDLALAAEAAMAPEVRKDATDVRPTITVSTRTHSEELLRRIHPGLATNQIGLWARTRQITWRGTCREMIVVACWLPAKIAGPR